MGLKGGGGGGWFTTTKRCPQAEPTSHPLLLFKEKIPHSSETPVPFQSTVGPKRREEREGRLKLKSTPQEQQRTSPQPQDPRGTAPCPAGTGAQGWGGRSLLRWQRLHQRAPGTARGLLRALGNGITRGGGRDAALPPGIGPGPLRRCAGEASRASGSAGPGRHPQPPSGRPRRRPQARPQRAAPRRGRAGRHHAPGSPGPASRPRKPRETREGRLGSRRAPSRPLRSPPDARRRLPPPSPAHRVPAEAAPSPPPPAGRGSAARGCPPPVHAGRGGARPRSEAVAEGRRGKAGTGAVPGPGTRKPPPTSSRPASPEPCCGSGAGTRGSPQGRGGSGDSVAANGAVRCR